MVTSLYYEALYDLLLSRVPPILKTSYRPDTSQMDPVSYISPSNGFAMPFSSFIPHICRVLDDLGLSIPGRTIFIRWVWLLFHMYDPTHPGHFSNAVTNLANHKNIAYRFMQPNRLSAAIELSVTTDPCVFTRIFLMWRGVSDEEMVKFADAGEKEADAKGWKSVIGFSPGSQDTQKFRVIETSIME